MKKTVMIAGACLALAGCGSSEELILKETHNLNTLTGFLRSTYALQGDYSGLSNVSVTEMDSFPPELKVSSAPDLIKSGWEENGITLSSIRQNKNDDSFSISYNGGYSTDDCIAFVSRVYSYYDVTTIDGVKINGVQDVRANCSDDAPIAFISQ